MNYQISLKCDQSNVKSIGIMLGKSILQVPDTGTRVLDNTRPFLRSSIESF